MISTALYFESHPFLRTAALEKLHEARWVTLLNTLLRRFCSTHRNEATDDLKRLVHFGIRVYTKAWFDTLKHPSIVDGPRIFHRLVVSLRNFDGFVDKEGVCYFLADPASGEDSPKEDSLTDDSLEMDDAQEDSPEADDSEEDDWDDDMTETEIMEAAVSWNAYWANHENVLVAMFHDDDIEVHRRAYDIVRHLQQKQVIMDNSQIEKEG